jgi:hypothetical protein
MPKSKKSDLTGVVMWAVIIPHGSRRSCRESLFLAKKSRANCKNSPRRWKKAGEQTRRRE